MFTPPYSVVFNLYLDVGCLSIPKKQRRSYQSAFFIVYILGIGLLIIKIIFIVNIILR